MCATVLSRQILPLTMKLVPTVTILSVRAKFQVDFFPTCIYRFDPVVYPV